MFKGRTLIAALAVALVAAMAAAVATAASRGSSSAKPITIAVPVGLTGANSTIAPSVIQESQFAAKEINAAGGILGRKVKIKVYDDQSGAAGAVQAYTAATLRDHVDGIVAMETSAARNAGEPIAQRSNTPFVYTSNYEGGACASNLYIDATVPVQAVLPMAKYFSTKFNAKNWFLIGSDYAYGRGELKYFRATIEQLGGKVVGEEYNPIDSSDWTSILEKVRQSKADAVGTAMAGGSPNVSFLKQWQAGGFKQPQASLSLDEGTAQDIGGATQGAYYPSPYFTGLANKANKKFLADLKKMFGSNLKTPNFLSEPQYYGVWLYALAVKKAGSTDHAKVLKALPKVKFTGPSGSVQMNVQHHAALNIWLGTGTSTGATKVVANFGSISPGAQCPKLK